MQHGGHADNGGGFLHIRAHGVLGPVYIPDGAGKGSVVPDGTAQHVGHAVFFTAVDNAVVDILRPDKFGNRTAGTHLVQCVQMVVVAVVFQFAGVNVLPKGGIQVCAFQVVGRQGVPGQECMRVASRDNAGKRIPGVIVKGESRPQHPENIAVVMFVFQQVIQLVVSPGKGALLGVPLPESEALLFFLRFLKAVRMQENAFRAVFRTAADHQIPLFQVPEFTNRNPSVLINRHAVHPAIPGQEPVPADFEIFRINAHGMVIVRCYAVRGCGDEAGIGSILKTVCRKIRRMVC